MSSTFSLDELSMKIAGLIGKFKLYLISRGRHFSNDGEGCYFCQNRTDNKRLHYLQSDTNLKKQVPSKTDVKLFYYDGNSLKTMGEQV